MQWIIKWTVLFCFFTPTFAGKPVFKMQVLTKAPRNLAKNASSSSQFLVTNQSIRPHTITMQPIQGITQITTTTGACTEFANLAPGSSCILNLRINGAKMPSQIKSGPVICQVNNGAPSPFLCYQPSVQDSLNIVQTKEELNDTNNWINVLIAQDPPPTDAAGINTYVQQIHALAPAAEQIHLRVVPIKNPTADPSSNPIYQTYADIIAALQTAYATNPGFQVGYHPDNSKGSEPYWGCDKDDWQCVLNDSIIVQNNINALADPKKLGQGFTIFSIEQSYLEYEINPNDAASSYKTVKSCLNPNVAAPGFSCPVATLASPVVKYGDVRGTYGGSDIYGADALDYGYPQYYNLVEAVSEANAKVLISNAPNSYFPPDSAANCLTGPLSSYTVIDANLSTKPIILLNNTTGLLPCFYPNNINPQPFPSNDVFTYQNQANPSLAAAYDAYLMSQLPPISETIDTNGAIVYITFSGEPQFLGATGWTLDKIDAFNQQLNANFDTLNLLIPGIIPPEAAPHAIKYAIWNFTSILQNES